MADILRFPKISGDQDVAVIIQWLKKEGDRIEIGDALFEFETDKSLIELESEVSGILLYIKIPAGEVKVNDVIAVIGEEGESLSMILKDGDTSQLPPMDKSKGVDVIRLPRLSDMMETAKIVKWNVEAGDSIKIGDIIAEVETDKAVIEIESFREGIVLYRLSKQEIVKENDILVIVGDKGAHFQDILEEYKS